ncbi:ribosome silencing factor [Oscillatoria sp. CS-180]|uniref:ribosome silencing factor n=1 Tax=Oscillatoria sp. CS-180 TaxID=3021720 RepID=UPI00232D706A|nr:ribosome silencing factor [Oscillatoria sp. CS-180]MDB9528325.1 ribosome silencing factor [Oscillatoria sp. CS-180]
MSNYQNSVTHLQSPSEPTTLHTSEDIALDLALAIAQAADERKGGDIRILKVSDVSYIADYFVIVTGFSSAQVRAIARNVTDIASEAFNRDPLRTEGQIEGSWVLQDYGEVIVHIFLPDAREYYGLEAFWGHAEEVPFDSKE